MNNSKLELELFNNNRIWANDEYIANEVMFLSKKFINSEILKYYKNRENELTTLINSIPYEKGSEINITTVGTKCELFANYDIGICIDEKTYLDYRLLKLMLKHLTYEFVYCTSVKFRDSIIIKIFSGEDEFVGAIMPMRKDEDE